MSEKPKKEIKSCADLPPIDMDQACGNVSWPVDWHRGIYLTLEDESVLDTCNELMEEMRKQPGRTATISGEGMKFFEADDPMPMIEGAPLMATPQHMAIYHKVYSCDGKLDMEALNKSLAKLLNIKQGNEPH